MNINSDRRNNIEKLIEIQKKILLDNWLFLNNTYNEINYQNYFHRTEIKHIKFLEEVKLELHNKLGCIPIFIFLSDFFYSIELPGPYYHCDKGLLLLYHLTSGLSIKKINKYMPYATFFKIYKTFYTKYDKELDQWINKMLKKDYLFTNNVIRMLYAKIKNPIKLKNVTCYLDGYDSRISYEDINLNKERLYSFKFKDDGLRTQFIIDINGFIMYSSKSEFCNDYTDGKMFETIPLENFLSTTDCLMIDGGYPLHLNNVIENIDSKGINIDLEAFCFPFRKEKNMDLSEHQKNYNKQLGSFRSDIESFFHIYTSIFNRFNKNNIVRITERIIYNRQIRLCNILYNLKKGVNFYNIDENNNYLYSEWLKDNFKYKDINEIPEFTLEPKYFYKQEHIDEKNKYQDDLINNMISQMTINNDYNMEEINDIENNVYEIENILSHRIHKREKYFLVKWKNYNDPTWVNEKNFIEKECIEEYLETCI
jgi:hypothetical protein